MSDTLRMVSLRLPEAIIARARGLAVVQERSVQAIYSRAIEVGLEVAEERDRIAAAAIGAVEGRRPTRVVKENEE